MYPNDKAFFILYLYTKNHSQNFPISNYFQELYHNQKKSHCFHWNTSKQYSYFKELKNLCFQFQLFTLINQAFLILFQLVNAAH